MVVLVEFQWFMRLYGDLEWFYGSFSGMSVTLYGDLLRLTKLRTGRSKSFHLSPVKNPDQIGELLWFMGIELGMTPAFFSNMELAGKSPKKSWMPGKISEKHVEYGKIRDMI